MDDILTTKEAAEYIRFSARTMAAWRQAGTGPPYKTVMGKIFYSKAELDKWYKEQK